jgi:hypothetical protein
MCSNETARSTARSLTSMAGLGRRARRTPGAPAAFDAASTEDEPRPVKGLGVDSENGIDDPRGPSALARSDQGIELGMKPPEDNRLLGRQHGYKKPLRQSLGSFVPELRCDRGTCQPRPRQPEGRRMSPFPREVQIKANVAGLEDSFAAHGPMVRRVLPRCDRSLAISSSGSGRVRRGFESYAGERYAEAG